MAFLVIVMLIVIVSCPHKTLIAIPAPDIATPRIKAWRDLLHTHRRAFDDAMGSWQTSAIRSRSCRLRRSGTGFASRNGQEKLVPPFPA